MSPPPRSLYYLCKERGTKVYNAQRALIGTTTGYTAIAHNGTSTGSIQIDTGGEKVWISGFGVKKEEGIFWQQLGEEGRTLFVRKNNTWL
jgi:hypothetical protein